MSKKKKGKKEKEQKEGHMVQSESNLTPSQHVYANHLPNSTT